MEVSLTQRTSRVAQLCPSFALVLLGNLLRPVAPWINTTHSPQPVSLDPAPASAAPRPPLPMLAPASDRDDITASDLIARINVERQQQRLPPFRVDGRLAASARVRAIELREEFSHDRPESTLEALLDAAGVSWAVAAETLARVVAPTARVAVDEAYRSLMASADHRDILLSPAYSRIGVATSQSRGRWLFVELVAD
jgi:uncharacterized protein YkwD